MKVGITGATGQLGQLVIAHLEQSAKNIQIVALVRNPEKAKPLFSNTIEIRAFDYNQIESLAQSLEGIDQLLLISSSEIGQRVAQHQAVIDAAKQANVKKIVYTSLLNADHSPLILAKEHKVTEQLLAESGLSYTILRNNWYSENYLGNLSQVISEGVLYGAAENGKISAAARLDYAQATANVLINPAFDQKIYELAGSTSFTLNDLANAITQVSGKPVRYQNLSAEDYAQALIGAGLPSVVADIITDTDVNAAKGVMFSESKDLEMILGRPTTNILDSVKQALA